VSSPLDNLSDLQRRAVTHVGGPLVLKGAAGTGKTAVLRARLQWLAEQGVAPERVLMLAPSRAAAEQMRVQLEDCLVHGYEELAVLTATEFCVRLLRAEALEAGLDPFFVIATRADRVALLLERVDELTLAHHDFRGRPAALMASFVARIDALKGELIDSARYAEWVAAQPDQAECKRDQDRDREFAQIYLDHDRLLADRGTPDAGELLVRACTLLGERPVVRARVAERYRNVLVDDFQDASCAVVKLVELLGAEHGQVTVAGDEHRAIELGPAHGSANQNLRDFLAQHADASELTLTQNFRCPPALQTAARAVVDGAEREETRPGPAGSTDGLGLMDGTGLADGLGLADRTGLPTAGIGIDGAAATDSGAVSFWRCANERTQAQSVAADIERLTGRGEVAPERIAVLVGSVGSESQPIAGALEERAIPYQVLGATAFFERAEVRDVLAWMRLLIDPRDASAVVRALARPPIELRHVDLARVIQIARRRKLDMVSALAAATESPQIPPEARERIHGFLRLHRDAAAALDTARPDLFVHRLIERIGLRRQQLFAAHTDVVERLVNLARLGELAADFARRAPQSTARELAGYLAAISEVELVEDETIADPRPRAVQVMSMHAARGREFDHVYVLGLQSASMPGASRHDERAGQEIPAELRPTARPGEARDGHSGHSERDERVAQMRGLLYVAMTRARQRLVLAYPAASREGALQPVSPFVEDARQALGADWAEREEELFGPAETLHATLRLMREEVLGAVARIGGRLGELRLDTDLDISHGVVRYLELVKLAALLERPEGQNVADALPDINARLLAAATSMQREIYETSPLDDTLLAAEHDDRDRAQALAARDEPSLEPFLPRRGEGLVLSASDIETYRACPLRYKFARVFRIPSEPTLNQRFGIVVHQVLERFHTSGGSAPEDLVDLLEAGWRRGGFGDSDQEIQLHEKARLALVSYHRRLREEPAEPVWFERSFAFRMGPHHLRGRVDRIDRLPDGGHELIDYKTGRPRTAAQLAQDIQLSLYAVGAREAWQLDAAQQAYYYVLDDEKVPVPRGPADAEWIRDTVMEVAEGILGQEFEPTPSHAACSMCDYRIVCPAAEK
jgi:DNA helicase II / ATP-dependent DNA helicase PcrA